MAEWSVGIDCRLGGLTHAGIGRYIVELVTRLVATKTNIHWTLFCQTKAQAEEVMGGSQHDNVSVVLTPIQQYSLNEQLALPYRFAGQKLDLLHVPHFNVPLLYTGKTVVTIHDLLWHEFAGTNVTTLPSLLYWPKYLGYRFIASQSIQRAQRIFVPTYTVKETVLRYYPKAENKVLVTREGIGSNLSELAEKQTTSHRQPFQLLYVGSLYPHKNVSLVLKALQRLPKYRLDIVSARSVFRERLEKEVETLQLTDRVNFLGKLSDRELAKAYQTCGVLLQPSISEGFGLTGLEGLAFQAPLLAADTPIFHEVYQDAAVFFDKHSVDSFIAGLRELEKESVTKEILRNAKSVTKQYSWDRLAKDTIAGYYEVLAQ